MVLVFRTGTRTIFYCCTLLLQILQSSRYEVYDANDARPRLPAAGYLDFPRTDLTNPDQVVQVSNLRFHVARNADATSPLAAALETIFRNPDVCCGKDSSLVDMVAAANPLSFLCRTSPLNCRGATFSETGVPSSSTPNIAR